MVFQDLILHDAHARFLCGKLGKSNTLCVRGSRRRLKNFIDLFL